MSREAKFLIYCIEEYKKAKSLTGKSAMALFHRYNILDYIIACYGALHTTGGKYIVEDIDLFIQNAAIKNMLRFSHEKK